MNSAHAPLSLSRRALLIGSGAAALSAVLPRIGQSATPSTLTPRETEAQLLPDDWPPTKLWSYGDGIGGPTLRYTQGDTLRVTLDNQLAQPTTVHWHGLRLPHAMDGVPFVSQDPVQPGETFTYEFKLPDAGTYWYHPHVNSSEQIGRGLYGALIVEEKNPPVVDRDLVWLWDDWRVAKDGSIHDSFENGMDISHGGRSGNYITLNGGLPEDLLVRKNERLRLRLLNVANARIFAFAFQNHDVHVIAIDGQPVAPHTPEGGVLILAPGQRADVILDCTNEAGSEHALIEGLDENETFKMLAIRYDTAEPLRTKPDPVPHLPANPLSEPDLSNAEHHDVAITGGAMSGIQGAVYKGEYRPIDELVQERRIWALNGVAAHTTAMLPILEFAKGSTQIITVTNETMFPHPMHLHGHAFRILEANGRREPYAPWADTVLLGGRQTAKIALVADNPGDWLFHCHILAHVQGGMSSIIRVT